MKKKIGILALMMFLLVGVTTTVKAATFSNLYVTKLTDGESRSYKSAGYSHADVTISSMTNSGKAYEVWIEEDATGYNITGSTGFSSPCSMDLYYKYNSYVNSSLWTRMNISTSVSNFDSCYFTGTWTPNGN